MDFKQVPFEDIYNFLTSYDLVIPSNKNAAYEKA